MQKTDSLRNILYLLTTFLILLFPCLSRTLHAAQDAPVTLFFSNDIQGETEPCG